MNLDFLMNRRNQGLIGFTLLLVGVLLVALDVNGAIPFIPSGDIVFNPSAGNYSIYNVYNFTMKNPPAACPANSFLIQWNGSHGTCSATSSAGYLNSSNLYVGNATTDNDPCGQSRPLVSNGPVDVTVPDDYATIALALCDVPYILRHNHTIRIDPDTYSGYENVTISHVFGADDFRAGAAGAVLRIRSSDISKPANIGSIFVSGFTGQANPQIEYLNITGASPYYSDSSTCGLCFFGVQQGDVVGVNFEGSRDFGILTYGGIAKVNGATFKAGTTSCLASKQFGGIMVRDNGVSGVCDSYAYSSTAGDLRLDNSYESLVGGVAQLIEGQGLVIWDNSSGLLGTEQRVMSGIDIIEDLDYLVFWEGTGADYYDDPDSYGFKWDYNEGLNEMELWSKNQETETKVWNITRDSQKVSFADDRIQITKTNTCTGNCQPGDFGHNLTHLCLCSAVNTWSTVALS